MKKRLRIEELESRLVLASPTQISQAITAAASWLPTQQNASTGQIGSSYPLADTAAAVQTLETKGNFPGGGEQYSSNVEKGLNFIFQYAVKVTNISQHAPGGGANVSCLIPGGDTFGVYFSQSSALYETGLVMAAIAASNTPTRVVTTGPLAGMTYQKVMIDTVQFIAWAQFATGPGEGGWRYTASANQSGSADNSVSQWPVIGLGAASQAPWNITPPSFVPTELSKWVTYIQGSDGGSGYTGPGVSEDSGVTGGLMVEFAYLGDSSTAARDQAALSYINKNWNSALSGFSGDFGNPYAMFAQFKGLTLSNVATIPVAAAHPPWSTSGDWYNDYADYLVNHQSVSGSYSSYYYYDTVLSTSWYTDILSGTVFVRPPQVQSAQIDDGTSQRSMVRSIKVTFQDPAILSTGAFQLTVPSDVQPVTLNVSPALGSGLPAQVYTITFSGNGIIGRSLQDGLYTLTIKANGVQNVAGQYLAADVPVAFFRLFGDYTGDGFVDNLDLAYLRLAAMNNPLYLQYFDYNGDGTVNSVDQQQAILRRYTNIFAPDITPPVVAYTAPAYGLSTTTNVTVTGLVTDNLSGVASLTGEIDSGPTFPVSFDAGGNFSFPTKFALDGSADGLHAIHLVAVDKAGNVSVRYDDTIVLDTSPPVVTYATPLPGTVTATNLTVTGKVTDLSGVSKLQASVDGGAASLIPFTAGGAFSFPTGLPLNGSADGPHTVHIIATDVLGNVSASYDDTFVLDTTPPVVTYAGPPSGSHTATDPIISGQVVDAISGAASLLGQVDSGPTFPVAFDAGGHFSFPITLPLDGSTDGSHTVHLIATDKFGNTSESYDDIFVIDTTGPVVSYSSPAPGSFRRMNPTVTGVVTDASGVGQLMASVDGGQASVVAVGLGGTFSFKTGLPVDGSADGPHTVHLIATDTLGNVSASYDDTFILDTTPPVITYYTPALGSTAKTNPTVTGQVTDALSGASTLVGQVDSGPTFPVSLDSTGHFSFTTSLALDGSADGTHFIHLIATDIVGNTSASYNDSFVLDTVAPKIFYASPSPGSSSAMNPLVSGAVTSANGIASIEGQIDSGPIFPVAFGPRGIFSFTTNLPLDGSADGSHTIHLIATDLLGNSSSSYDDTFILDTTPPVVTYATPASGSTARTNPTVTGQVTDALSGVSMLVGQVDSGPTFPVSLDSTGHFSFATSLALDGSADGAHVIHLVATDAVGNVSGSYDDPFSLYATAPSISFTSPTSGSTSRNNPLVTGTVTRPSRVGSLEAQVDSGPLFSVSIDPTGAFLFSPSLPLDGSADGPHAIHMYVTDSLSGLTFGPYDDTFSLDTTAPVVTYATPVSGSTARTNPTVTGQVTDALSGVSTLVGQVDSGPTFPVSLDSTGHFSFATSLALDGSADGAHVIHLVATDAVGNVSGSYDDPFLLDTSVPTISYATPAPGSATRYNPLVTGTVTRPSRVGLLEAQVDSGSLIYISFDSTGAFHYNTSLLLDGSADGPHTIHMFFTDKVSGQTYGPFDDSFLLETQPPVVTVTESTSRVPLGSSVTIAVSATDKVSVASLGLTVGGVPVTLDSSGKATITARQLGSVQIVGSATDQAGNVGTQAINLIVYDPNNHTPPNISFTIGNGSPISGPIDVIGTVSSPSLVSYELDAIPIDGGAPRTIFTGSTSVVNGKLGTFDPSLLANDSYIVQLTATDANGNVATVDASDPVSVAGNLKLGDFTLSFTDLTVPISGIPITITRTYDTLDSSNSEDFGYGWRLEIGDTDLRTSVAKTGYEDYGIYNPFSDGDRVYVTVPGGRREGFTFTPQLAPGIEGSLLGIYYPVFTADPGVTDTLSVPQVDLRQLDDGTYEDFGGDFPYNPSDSSFGGTYTLTSKDGLTYTIVGDTGKLETAADANHNVLTFSSQGIFSSSGERVTFQRDSAGRIVGVTDAAGQTIHYAYDSAGNLISVTDRQGDTTKFDYRIDFAHYLQDVIDPLGRVGARADYDTSGRLTQLTDAAGHVTKVGTVASADSQTFTDALGNQTFMQYDDRGNVLTEVDALGGVTTKTYDANNRKLTETDPLGNTTSYTYDSRGNILSVTDPLGRVTRFTYDSSNHILTVTDPLGHKTTATTDAAGDVLTLTDPTGVVVETNTFDAAGHLTSTTDALGRKTSYIVNDKGLATTITTPIGHSLAYTYDANGNQTGQSTTRTDSNGATVLVSLATNVSSNGQPISITDPDGQTNSYTYDAAGETTGVTDRQGDKITYAYDATGNRIKTTYPDGTSTTSTYDADNNIISETDRAGRTTRYEYDALNHLIRTDYPDGSSVSQQYDADGRVIATIDGDGHTTTTTYDAAGEVTSIKDAAGGVTSFTYDLAGHRISATDPLGHTTTYTYDADGREIKITAADGTSQTKTYDVDGEVIATTDQNKNTTYYQYDALGRLTKVTNALGGSTSYGYDELGDAISQTNPLGQTTRQSFDSDQHATGVTLPLGQVASVTYDSVGDPLSSTDFNGQTTKYTYDSNERLIREVFADGTERDFTYTATGQRATSTDARGLVTYSYDARDRLTKVVEPDGSAISYTYDAAGNRTSITTPAGTTTYTFDALNRIATVTDPSNGTTHYTYDADSNLLTTSYPDGSVETRTYDILNRLLTLVTVSAGGATIQSETYTYDADGNRVEVDELGGRVVRYSYDVLNRLTEEKITDPAAGNRVLDYTYDAAGNRISLMNSAVGLTTYAYNANGMLSSETVAGTVTQFTYDADGHLLTKFTDAVDQVINHWNAEGNLVEVDTITPNGTTRTVYAYDADGNRVDTTVDGVETRALVDIAPGLSQVVLEYRPDGTILSSYVFGNAPISQQSSGVTSIYHADGTGSVRLLTSPSGAVTDTFTYSAFGVLLARTGTTVSGHMYAGEPFDPTTGLSYLRSRYYDPSLGQFLSMDPAAPDRMDPFGPNRYAYTHDNPVDRIDPSGRQDLAEIGAAIAIGGILASIGAYGVLTFGVPYWIGPNGFQSKPDAGLFGFSVSVSPTALIEKIPGAAGNIYADELAVALILTSGVGGFDVLLPSTSQEWWYVYYGVSFGFDTVFSQFSDGRSWGSIQAYAGLVWNVKQPQDYAGPFWSTSASSGQWGGVVPRGATVFTTPERGQSYGFSVPLAQGDAPGVTSSGLGLTASWTYYEFIGTSHLIAGLVNSISLPDIEGYAQQFLRELYSNVAPGYPIY